MPRSRTRHDPDKHEAAAITAHQAAAAAAPHRSVRELIDTAAREPRSGATRGNFQDFDLLFEQLTKAPVMELGNPLPSEKYLPKPVGSCPAAHNRALLGEEHPD